jgi:hypothetical protein
VKNRKKTCQSVWKDTLIPFVFYILKNYKTKLEKLGFIAPEEKEIRNWLAGFHEVGKVAVAIAINFLIDERSI